MKFTIRYSTELQIRTNTENIIRKFSHFENRLQWRKDLLDQELIRGNPRENNSQYKLLLTNNTEVKETLLVNDLPATLFFSYDTNKKYFTEYHIFFKKESNIEHSLWVLDTEIHFKHILDTYIHSIFTFIEKNKTKKYMKDFKNFVEKSETTKSETKS